MKGDEGNGAHRVSSRGVTSRGVTSRGVTSRRRARTRPARRSRSRFRGLTAGAVGVVLASAALAACGTAGASTGPVSLSFYFYPDNSAATQTALNNCSKQSGGKYTLSYQRLPEASDQQRQQLVRRLAAHDATIDIMGLDVTWESEFAQAGWIEPWTGANKAQATSGTLKPALDTAIWKNTLYAVPDNSNTQLLWYNSALVPNPPKTWAEMIADAEHLAKEGKPHYIEIQGAQYEGATVWGVRRHSGQSGLCRRGLQHGPRTLPREAAAAHVQEYRRAGRHATGSAREARPGPDQVGVECLARVPAHRDDPLPAALARKPDRGRRAGGRTAGVPGWLP